MKKIELGDIINCVIVDILVDINTVTLTLSRDGKEKHLVLSIDVWAKYCDDFGLDYEVKEYENSLSC